MRTLLLLSLLFACALAGPVWLQVSHQAPSALDTPVTFTVNGEFVIGFSEMVYSEGSEFTDVSAALGFVNDSVVQTFVGVMDNQGNTLLLIPVVLQTNVFQSIFLTDDDETTELAFEYTVIPAQYPNSMDAWFNVINLSPDDIEVTFQVDEVVIKKDADYSESSGLYSGVTGQYVFEAWSGNKLLASTQVFLPAGSLTTVVFNGLESENPPLRLVSILDLDPQTYVFCGVRAVQAIPESGVFVWYGDSTEPQLVGYGEYTEYSQLVAVPALQVYLSTNDTKPEYASVTFDCQKEQDFSVLIQGPSQTLLFPIASEYTHDQSSAPLYQDSRVRVTLLANPMNSDPTLVYLNGQLLGAYLYGQSTNYSTQTEEEVNVTFVQSGLIHQHSFEIEAGIAYTIYSMGTTTEANPFIVVLATDFESSAITPVDGGTTGGDDDDDDDDGLSGGAIAGIVIGVLVGVALLGFIVFYVIRRRRVDYSTVG